MPAWLALRSVCAKEGWWRSDCSHRRVGRAALGRGRILRLVKEMCMLDEIRAKRDEIYAIARKHKAEKLWVFGSCARKEERPDSDVDFLVKFGDGIGMFELFDFEGEMSNEVGRKVDLINVTALDRSPCFAYNVKKEMMEL